MRAEYPRGSFPPFDVRLRLGQDRERELARILGEPGEVVTIEVKSEPRAQRFVFVKTGHEGRPSGLATTTADWWAYEVAPDRWVILPTADLRVLVDSALARYGERRGGAFGASTGAIVPKAWLVGL